MTSTSDPHLRTKTFCLLLAAISLVGLILRLWLCYELQLQPSVVKPLTATDMATYLAMGHDIARGNWPEVFYYQPFYYAIFLPAVFKLCGPGAWGLLLTQALLGTATIWLTGWLTARLFGRRAGLAAASLLALARYPIFYTPFALMAPLQSFWLILLAVLIVRAYDRRSNAVWATAAAVLGLAVITRGNVLLLIPVAVGLLVYRYRRRPRTAIVLATAFLVITYLPQLPFALRNWQSLDRWTGASTSMDAVLALGNAPESAAGGLFYPPSYVAWLAKADWANPQRQSVVWQTLNWAWHQPAAFVELKWRAFLLFWNAFEIPNNVAIEVEGAASHLIRQPVLLNFGLLATLALAGMAWRIPRDRHSGRRLLPMLLIWSYCAATVAAYILARFRLPVVPLLCVYAGCAVDRLWQLGGRLRQRRLARPTVIQAILVISVAALLVFRGMGLYQSFLEPAVVRWCRPHGVFVKVADGYHSHDHGPRPMGGWSSLEVSATGLTVTKQFSLPPADGDIPGQLHTAALRVACLDLAATGVVATVSCGSRVIYQGLQHLRGSGGLVWLELPLAAVPVTMDQGLDLMLALKPAPGAPMALVFDRQRDYGRTQVQMPSEGAPADYGECCLELKLEQNKRDQQ